jgi:RNA polymerase sigma-70 factor (ECF subfamily)
MHTDTTERLEPHLPSPPGGGPPDDPCPTSTSLLLRIRDRNDDWGWKEFDRRYSPMIRRWCRDWFPRDADDLVQDVLTKLVAAPGVPTYDRSQGRFRGWLKTFTQHLMTDLYRRHILPGPGVGVGLDHPEVASREAGLDLEQRLAEEYDLELLEIARRRVCHRVAPRTWDAYVAIAEQGRSTVEVARELGLSIGSVYQARYSVIKLLRQEIADLGGFA